MALDILLDQNFDIRRDNSTKEILFTKDYKYITFYYLCKYEFTNLFIELLTFQDLNINLKKDKYLTQFFNKLATFLNINSQKIAITFKNDIINFEINNLNFDMSI